MRTKGVQRDRGSRGEGSQEVRLIAKVLYKHNRASVQSVNYFILCQGNSLCAHSLLSPDHAKVQKFSN